MKKGKKAIEYLKQEKDNLIGKSIIVLGDSQRCHRYSYNDRPTIEKVEVNNSRVLTKHRTTGEQFYVYFTDIAFTSVTIEELEEDKKEMNDELNDIQNRIQFLQDVKREEFNELEYKVYKIIKLVKDENMDEEVTRASILKTIAA